MIDLHVITEIKEPTNKTEKSVIPMSKLRQDADAIIQAAITAAQPDEAVRKALEGRDFGSGRVVLVAAGKGAWQMASAASRILGSRIDTGIVITKYDHSKGPIANFTIQEAGHPIPDENSFTATQQALDLVSGLTAQDTVLFLLSGGGSALFEKPLIPAADLEELTHNLLVCGADIVEINTLRKRFSGVKGGRFAQLCAPAHVGFHRAFGYSGRSAGYDCLRPRLPG